MTEFDRIVQAAEWVRDSNRGVTAEATPKPHLRGIYAEYLDKDFHLSPSQIQTFSELAIDILFSGGGWEFLNMSHILAFGGATGFDGPLETALEVDPFSPREGIVHPHRIAISLLQEAGVLEPTETPLFHDRAHLHVKKTDSPRTGMLLLTEDRIIVVGFWVPWISGGFRLYYDDWKEKEWTRSLDHVYFGHIQEPQVRKNRLQFKYATRYIQVKKSTFYGPYWVRFNYPDRIIPREGKVSVILEAQDQRRQGWVPSKIVPKDDHRRRNGVISSKVIDLITQ
jgi:hypothetical protein